MFLALPMVAVLKIIFDRSNIFKPWGILLGDENTEKLPFRFPKLRIRNKSDDKQSKIENDMNPIEKKTEE
jgi:hypothetical protein